MKKVITSLPQLQKFADSVANNMKQGRYRKIGLIGPLGAGKTTFVSDLTKSLGITDKISSPTFTIMHEYGRDKNLLLHIDLYRVLPTEDETVEQIIEAINTRRFVVVEWADRIQEIANYLDIIYKFTHGKNEQTRIVEEANGHLES